MVRCSTSPLFMRSVQTTSLWVQVGSARSRRYSSAGDSGVSSSASHSFTRLTPSGAVTDTSQLSSSAAKSSAA